MPLDPDNVSIPLSAREGVEAARRKRPAEWTLKEAGLLFLLFLALRRR